MLRVSYLLSLLMLFGTAVFWSGCKTSSDKTTPDKTTPDKTTPDKTSTGKTTPDKTMPAQPAASAKGTIAPGPAELSAEDRALIAKQGTCPVTGGRLGSMGEPVKVVVKGQTVFLCCPGCEEAIQKDPDKYLAKLKKS